MLNPESGDTSGCRRYVFGDIGFAFDKNVKKEKMFKNILEVDLGATSGRAILATCSEDKITEMREVLRFPNHILQVFDKCYWNIWEIYSHIVKALKSLASENVHIDSIGVDTWGVDFVTVGPDGMLSSLPRSYRDPYTDGIPEEFFRIIPHKKVYEKTGTQILNFNSLYQLYAQTKEGSEALKNAGRVLFLPDAISYLLTGNMVCESTILSTAQIFNLNTGKLDDELLAAAGADAGLFPEIVRPGAVIGHLSESLQARTGLPAIPVVAVAGHDTASAVAAIPSPDEHFAYISSGTWSLIGIESEKPIITEESYAHNYTNEGGIDGTTRFLKNITGMWILEQCLETWKRHGESYTYHEIVAMASEAEPFAFFINPDDPVFSHPASMPDAIENYCMEHVGTKPQDRKSIVRCIFDSLAMKYRYALEFLQQCSSTKIERLHIIGGGSRNALLNQMVADSTGLTVVAGPVEATALGNIGIQLRSLGLVKDRWDMRRYLSASAETETFVPKDVEQWRKAYDSFLEQTNL